MWIAIGVLSEPAWKPVFSVIFGLSSLKGTSIPSSSAPKTPQKYKPFRSKNLNIIKIFVNKAKAQRILDVFASILTQFTGIFIYLNRSSDNTPMANLLIYIRLCVFVRLIYIYNSRSAKPLMSFFYKVGIPEFVHHIYCRWHRHIKHLWYFFGCKIDKQSFGFVKPVICLWYFFSFKHKCIQKFCSQRQF